MMQGLDGLLQIKLLIVISIAVVAVSAEKLSLVHTIWRHGDRNPGRVFPTDHGNAAETWPRGFGELTKIGEVQLYKLGQMLHRRYINNTDERYNIVSNEFNPFQIYVRSSDYNRTLMSAIANLAGFYPARNDSILPIQPVPVHTVPKYQDYLLRIWNRCPRYSALKRELISTDKNYTTMVKQQKEFLKFLKTETGLKWLKISSMYKIKDPLLVERIHNETHEWPSWVNESIFEEIAKLKKFDNSYMFKTDEMARLRAGPLLTEIVERIVNRSQGTLDHRLKYVAYSAHDLTTAGFLRTLGSYPGYLLGYASCVTLELWQRTNGSYFVRVFYSRNHTENALDTVKLRLSGCSGYDCPLSKFVERSKPFNLRLFQVKDACLVSKTKPSPSAPSGCGTRYKATAIAMRILSIVFASAVIHLTSYLSQY